MNEQLIKFIELCLTDGIISDKEREVIFRKASEYNVDIDECEIILDSMIHQKSIEQNGTISKNEIVSKIDYETNNSDRDALFREAAEIVVKYQNGSNELLKEKLKVGTNRAERLIDELQKAGILSDFDKVNSKVVKIKNLETLDNFLLTGKIEEEQNVSTIHIENKLKEYVKYINLYYDFKNWEGVVKEVQKAENEFNYFLKKKPTIAIKYLWSLYYTNNKELTLNEIIVNRNSLPLIEAQRVLEIVEDKSSLNDIVGLICKQKGLRNNDLGLLQKALSYFESHNYDNNEIKVERINETKQKILAITLNEKNKELGLNQNLLKQFIDGKYNRLWKVNCYLSEPIYLKGNLKIEKWVDSNVSFFVPSIGILEEKNAIAFIKANWVKYNEFICDKNWKSKGRKYDFGLSALHSFDKRKIEVIELNEILF